MITFHLCPWGSYHLTSCCSCIPLNNWRKIDYLSDFSRNAINHCKKMRSTTVDSEWQLFLPTASFFLPICGRWIDDAWEVARRGVGGDRIFIRIKMTFYYFLHHEEITCFSEWAALISSCLVGILKFEIEVCG